VLLVAMTLQSVSLWVVAVLTLLFGWILVMAFAKGSPPGPSETAVAYEHAWDRLDFRTLWNLSSPLLRDGRSRDQFVRDKQLAYQGESQLAGLVKSVRPAMVDTSGPVARVLTRLDLSDGSVVVDEILLEQTGSAWQVTAYTMVTKEQQTKTP
jgi:hypothetical protein